METQIKTTKRYHLTLIRMTTIKKKQQPKPENNVGKDMEKLNPCALLVRM